MTDTPLRLLLAFDNRIQRDRDQPANFLHRRDRRFALDCQQQGVKPDVRRWLAQMDRLSGTGEPDPAVTRELGTWQRISAGFLTAGAVFGVITMLGLLFYEGGQRINVTVFLAFVLLQFMLALATTIQAWIGWQPWRRLVHKLFKGPPSPTRAALYPLLAARAAQAGGLAFATAGLLTLLVMVVVQDLAFGWSTTLNTASASYHTLVSTLAQPWGWLWPAAAPSAELVDATRFFRAAPDAGSTMPERWGQWWPFLVMVWLVWAWLPRLLLLIASHGLLNHRARRLLARHPGMQSLLYRMETPVIDTGNEHNDATDLPDTQTASQLGTLPEAALCICWAGAGEQGLPRSLSSIKGPCHQAGGNVTLSDDEAVLDKTAQQLATMPEPRMVLLTRSWQPPTGELSDFLAAARARWPNPTRVTLVPLAGEPDQLPAEHLLAPWLRFADRQPSGFVTVAVPAGQTDSEPQS